MVAWLESHWGDTLHILRVAWRQLLQEGLEGLFVESFLSAEARSPVEWVVATVESSWGSGFTTGVNNDA
ncbi:hypothetical protein D3C77_658950 [compost metagenome]